LSIGTSVLMRRLRENAMLEAEVTATGDVLVEGQHVGMLQGFRFTADPKAGGSEVKALNLAAMKALGSEIEARAARVVLAGDDAFVLSHDGLIRWTGEPVARLTAGERFWSRGCACWWKSISAVPRANRSRPASISG
jgi:ATP-dependent RNA helicase SUPV3L1/SUV3